MRILVVTHNYPRWPGDRAGGFVATLSAAAASRGHDVLALAPHAPGAARFEHMDGVRVERFRYAPDWAERVAYRGDLHERALRDVAVMFALPAFLLRFRFAVQRLADEFRPDVVHAHWWFPAGWLASRTKLPLIVTCHGTDVQLLRRRGMRMLADRTMRRATSLTTVSSFLAERLRARLGEGMPAPVVTPLPVDPAPFQRVAAIEKAIPARVLYAGNLVPSKGLEVLLDAAAILVRSGLAFRLRMLGDGPLRSALVERAARLGITDRLDWGGFVSREAMPEEYARATVTVLPSVGEEGLGLTLVESLLASTAVVGTSRGGIPDVVDHDRTGLLARPGDATDLARQLERLLTEEHTRQRLAAEGRRHVLARHSPQTAVKRFLDLYDAAAGQ